MMKALLSPNVKRQASNFKLQTRNFKIVLAALLISLGVLIFSQVLRVEGATVPPVEASNDGLLYRARIVLSTSSDWTRLYIRSGERILNAQTTLLQGNAARVRATWDKEGL